MQYWQTTTKRQWKSFSIIIIRACSISPESFLKIEDGIDDIIQEVFVKIWQNRKKINSQTTFNSYIFTITRNLLLNELRSRLNNEKTRDEIRNLSLAKEYSSMEQIEYRDIKEKVDQLINTLPERQKEIFILSRTEGLSYKEIAEKLILCFQPDYGCFPLQKVCFKFTYG